VKLSPHFDSQEFACKCLIRGLRSTPGSCQGQEWVSEKLVEKLEELRAALGNKPITVTSGCRCATYNRYVGGAKGSQHVLGTAADITVKDVKPSDVAAAAEKIGFGGVGRYSTFTHVDVRRGKARWEG
jgi:uncharacterized protein YcbK (DUF882 family)